MEGSPAAKQHHTRINVMQGIQPYAHILCKIPTTAQRFVINEAASEAWQAQPRLTQHVEWCFAAKHDDHAPLTLH